MSRLSREQRTITVMITLYCRDHHGRSSGTFVTASQSGHIRGGTGQGLCTDCESLLAYADQRLARCRFAQSKPTCARCTVHCYGPVMRERIRVVMRYSGPRMTIRHPILALAHLVDSRRGVVIEADESDSGKGQAIP